MTASTRDTVRVELDVVDASHPPELRTGLGLVDLIDYSAFKHGSGDIAHRYGSLLAQKLAEVLAASGCRRIAVASSAYLVAPPASHALMPSALAGLRAILPVVRFDEFKIHRAVLTEGDYASMSLEERAIATERSGLSLPVALGADVDGVVLLDDIFVTGTHEGAIRSMLERLGHASLPTLHGYVLGVRDGTRDPWVEARINHEAVASLRDVADLSRSVTRFVPNARVCKFLAAAAPCEIDEFCRLVDGGHLRTLASYLVGDGLMAMECYASGVGRFLKICDSMGVYTSADTVRPGSLPLVSY
jgi:hypothetical protein